MGAIANALTDPCDAGAAFSNTRNIPRQDGLDA